MLDSGLQANRIPGHPVYQSPARAPTLPCSVPYHVRGKQPSSLLQANTTQDKAQAFKNQQKDSMCGSKGSQWVRGFLRLLLGKFLHFGGTALRILKLLLLLHSAQLHVIHPKEDFIMAIWSPAWIQSLEYSHLEDYFRTHPLSPSLSPISTVFKVFQTLFPTSTKLIPKRPHREQTKAAGSTLQRGRIWAPAGAGSKVPHSPREWEEDH